MKQDSFWTLLGGAIKDAALAEEIARDAAYRRWLREDTDKALQVFALAHDSDAGSPDHHRPRHAPLTRIALHSHEA